MTVTALTRGLYDVTSETDSEKSYVVTPGKDCSCPHHRARGAYCKHLKAVDIYRESQLQETALERAGASGVSVKKSIRPHCRFCGKPLSMNYTHTQDYWDHNLRRSVKEKLGEAGFKQWEKEQKSPTGKHGRDDYFCSLRCGSWWAVFEIKRRESNEH